MNKYKQVSFILILVFISNLTIASLKIFIGHKIHSEGITADGFQSLTDASSNIIGLVGVKMASRPADINHPYGHKKYETLSSMFIAVLLLIITFRIITGSIMWFLKPVITEVTNQSLIIVGITLTVNIIVATVEYVNAKRLQSDILQSDSLNTRSDVFVSTGILLSLLGIKFGLPNVIDPIASLLVACVIIYASIQIFKMTTSVLVDHRMIDPKLIRSVVLQNKDVRDVMNIRSRGRLDDIYVDLILVLEPTMSINKGDQLYHQIESSLKSEINPNIHLFVHFEPLK